MMDNSPDIWARLVTQWRSLSPGAQDNIIGGLVVAAVLGLLAVSRKGLAAFIRRFHWASAASPTQAESTTIETQPAAPQQPQQRPTPQSQDERQIHITPSEVLRPHAVNFIPRRDKEGNDILEQLRDKLAPGTNNLVALWGPGGVGKTRLAREAARACADTFAHRLVWVSADGRPDFTLSTLLDPVATHLGRKELHQLALLAQNKGELEEARRLYEESLEIERRLGNPNGVAITLHQLGRLSEESGDKAAAAQMFREALGIFERLNSPIMEVVRRSLKRIERGMTEEEG